MAHKVLKTVRCAKCGRIESEEAAKKAGWRFIQKAGAPKGTYQIICTDPHGGEEHSAALSLEGRGEGGETATLDVSEAAPYEEARREARRRNARKKAR